MPSPRNLKELRSLPGRLQPLISKARTRCQSFSRQDANFVWTPKHKERGFYSSSLIWSFLCLLPSCRLLLLVGHSCFSCSPPTTFPYFGTLWQKTMTLGRKDKAIDYLRPCSQRLSTFSIWYWGEPAIKRRPKLSKRWKKHTLIDLSGINKIRREIKARKHLVSSDFYWETNSIWLNQRKEQVAHDLNDQAMKSSFVDLKLKWRREWSWKSSWLLWISCSCVLTWSHLC